MQVVNLEVGLIGTNCYIAYNENTREGVVIDPGGDAATILKTLENLKVSVKAIFLTHGHSDHIMALEKVRAATGAPVYIAERDGEMITNAEKNLSMFMGSLMEGAPAEHFFTDGEDLHIAGMDFHILATPGHTQGGVCICSGEFVFCGDTIFAESIGRTDFPGGNYKQLIKSIKDKILPMDDDVHLMPGHGPATTVGWERRRNPFLQ